MNNEEPTKKEDEGSKFLDFVLTAYKVKTLPRTGWLRNGISGTSVEHVGDHMFGMALMSTLLLSGMENVDVFHVVKLCIVHDLAESIVGDITPHCGVSKEEKAAQEMAAMKKMAATLPEETGTHLMRLFEEFEENKTPAALVAHDMDKLDMVLQAYMYEQDSSKGDVETGRRRDLSEFFSATAALTSSNTSLSSAQLRLASVADALAQRRSNNVPNKQE